MNWVELVILILNTVVTGLTHIKISKKSED